MLKGQESSAELERHAAERIRDLVSQVPAIHDIEVEQEVGPQGHAVDFSVRLMVGGHAHRLICEVKSSGQPRYVRDAIRQLSYVHGSFPHDTTSVFVAPYLSEDARAICDEAGVGYADLEGNCRLAFDTVFIERLVATRPPAVKRELKSLFGPKSAQVLRRLLREPGEIWKVVDLAAASQVSLGQVSNVRQALLQREWAVAETTGLRLTAPRALLDAWRENYTTPTGERIFAYTAAHGRQLDDALAAATLEPDAQIALASFTAARWIAPFVRGALDTIYCDSAGWATLRRHIEVGPIQRGANLEVVVLEDKGPLLDSLQLAPGRVVTSLVQTYLDLWAAGDRGQEAAEHLRRDKMDWTA
jgi:hypothetical protein